MGGSPYGHGDRVIAGGIGESPTEAMLVGEDQLPIWDLAPHHQLAGQAWKCTSPKKVTSEILIKMRKEYVNIIAVDDPGWIGRVARARKRLSLWCEFYDAPDNRRKA